MPAVGDAPVRVHALCSRFEARSGGRGNETGSARGDARPRHRRSEAHRKILTPLTGPPAELRRLESRVVSCRRCPRLVAWREEAARRVPRRFRGEKYWSRPLPAFGNPAARLLIVGLAPAAHGGNRTGRIFTGDESGNFLFRALHAVGLSNRPRSLHRGDGLELRGALLSAACRCAPPANRPLPIELENCREYLERELSLLARPRVLVALGALGFETILRALAASGVTL